MLLNVREFSHTEKPFLCPMIAAITKRDRINHNMIAAIKLLDKRQVYFTVRLMAYANYWFSYMKIFSLFLEKSKPYTRAEVKYGTIIFSQSIILIVVERNTMFTWGSMMWHKDRWDQHYNNFTGKESPYNMTFLFAYFSFCL